MFRAHPRPYPVSTFDSTDHVALIHARGDADVESAVLPQTETYPEDLSNPYNAVPRPSIRVYSWKEQDFMDPDTIVIISVPLVPPVETVQHHGRRRSIIGKLKPNNAKKFKIVIMPLSDCKMYFARDSQGVYRGEMPERVWTAEELEEKYGKYKTLLPTPTIRTAPSITTGRFVAPGFGQF